MDTILIAFNGFRGSGKNTAGNEVIKWGLTRGLNVQCRGFADIMKVAAMRSLGIPVATNMNDAIVMADSFKQSGFINFEFPDMNYANGITGRQYLKFFGTEGHRDVFGNDFWLDLLLPQHPYWASNFAEQIDHNHSIVPEIAVITDLRFVNEAKRVHGLGGQVVEIHRPAVDKEGEEHISEQRLPQKWISDTLENDSSLEAFETKVNSWMTAEHHMKFVEKPDLV